MPSGCTCLRTRASGGTLRQGGSSDAGAPTSVGSAAIVGIRAILPYSRCMKRLVALVVVAGVSFAAAQSSLDIAKLTTSAGIALVSCTTGSPVYSPTTVTNVRMVTCTITGQQATFRISTRDITWTSQDGSRGHHMTADQMYSPPTGLCAARQKACVLSVRAYQSLTFSIGFAVPEPAEMCFGSVCVVPMLPRGGGTSEH